MQMDTQGLVGPGFNKERLYGLDILSWRALTPDYMIDSVLISAIKLVVMIETRATISCLVVFPRQHLL